MKPQKRNGQNNNNNKPNNIVGLVSLICWALLATVGTLLVTIFAGMWLK